MESCFYFMLNTGQFPSQFFLSQQRKSLSLVAQLVGFSGAVTSILCHWRSSHPALDASRVRSLVLGGPGFRTSEWWAGAAQPAQWPQGAGALPRDQERLGSNPQYAQPH